MPLKARITDLATQYGRYGYRTREIKKFKYRCLESKDTIGVGFLLSGVKRNYRCRKSVVGYMVSTSNPRKLKSVFSKQQNPLLQKEAKKG